MLFVKNYSEMIRDISQSLVVSFFAILQLICCTGIMSTLVLFSLMATFHRWSSAPSCCVDREVQTAASPLNVEKLKLHFKIHLSSAKSSNVTINTPFALKNLPFFKRSMLAIEMTRSRTLLPSDFKTAGKPM